ncbi:MAG: DUF1684 domain-containing protein [Candidatus Heimdallarchaeota archaeon]|nr:DUF1684 domain-containing protein [Candidatus Heimdallarchaeota archaeon]
MSYKKSIENHRFEKDRFLKNHPQSPIGDPKIKKRFQMLEYFPIDESWRFELELIEYDEIETLEMELSTGGISEYMRIGYLEFLHPITSTTTRLNVYENIEHPGYFFVPFRDQTSGRETYGAGRYLDLEKDEGKFILDFNLAYNPFCAYSDNFTCPIAPFENWLEEAITAGEKDFPFH